ncbi:hypothetical protein N658DRAFT_542761 [Parathielavia hyrcaniae]|uniref:Myb-like domain-containing protein n=1 Tax=Parathielavia hyrcaniae TaxID=113614 RepID=A0AAN6PVX7_9PEZI|nr:hypothetical protein N658DRAFT_542761 [Parathielavia hyrcaniae]
MLISPAKPQTEVVSLRDNVLSIAAADFAPWLFELSQINTALFLHQQRLHDMSYNNIQMSLKAPKQPPPQHGLPLAGSALYYPDTQSPGNGLSTAEDQSAASHRASRSSTSSYVSHYSLPSSTNVLETTELLDLPYWHVVPPGAAALPPFAHGGDPHSADWEHAHQGAAVNPSLVDYGHYGLGMHASVLPQTVFRPGEALHGMPLASMAEREASNSNTTSSKLFASSEMMEAMALDDDNNKDPGPSSWGSSACSQGTGYGGPRCVDISESDVTNSSSWAEGGDGETVSPNMLRLRHTPSLASSCESLHTSFLDGDSHCHANMNPVQPLAVVVDPVPSQSGNIKAATANTRKRGGRKMLPDRGGQRSSASDMMAARRQQSLAALSDPPPSPPRKLTRLRPKPARLMGTMSPSPSRSHLPFSSSRGGTPKPSTQQQRVELPDRMSKDDFLVRQKQLGMTYKEIRRMGGFTEAESTLRGRYRTLTKCREARVRKPEWSETDLRLLERAVRTLTLAPDNNNNRTTNTARVPWKKVAEYIVAHGGSYHFGNSTCRKRWDELVAEMEMDGRRGGEGRWYF